MKRFHVHVVVENIAASVDFYSRLFGQAPSKKHDDYAKWMLDDPRMNFAISARGHAVGVNHFGFQVDSDEELAELRKLADAASLGKISAQGETACCYAMSRKHWTIDPQGLAWEHFHTMDDVLQFGNDTAIAGAECCIPETCCLPGSATPAEGACCG